ncbi:hypothetical protein [Acinetobacter bereziniae]|uniref:hypothetical protein n=1 Tax=Acinetobacter bereziniae TaxID=106648 RepID=UPI00124D9A30|nr:hypothetical protein [Acinetobacter bereziniae]
MGLSKIIIFIIFLSYSMLVSANNELFIGNHKIYFKHGGENIFLFTDNNYCFNKDAFSIEKLTNDDRKYLFVNYTNDCNPSGLYQIFDISRNKAEKFYLSPLNDPIVDYKKKQIIENFKVGAITYTRIYALRNGKYSLLEELETLGNDLNLSKIYADNVPVYSLQDDSKKIIKNAQINKKKVFLLNQSFILTKKYLVEGDKFDIDNVVKINGQYYLSVIFKGKYKLTKGYIRLSEIL